MLLEDPVYVYEHVKELLRLDWVIVAGLIVLDLSRAKGPVKPSSVTAFNTASPMAE